MIYQNVQHEKEMVYGLLDRPFKGQRPQERPKSFLACGSRGAAEIGRLQCLCVLCSTVCACARARSRTLRQQGRTEREASPPPVQQGCITHPLPLFNMVQSLQGSVQWLL